MMSEEAFVGNSGDDELNYCEKKAEISSMSSECTVAIYFQSFSTKFSEIDNSSRWLASVFAQLVELR